MENSVSFYNFNLSIRGNAENRFIVINIQNKNILKKIFVVHILNALCAKFASQT